jgi:hypothetical protein
MDNSIIEAGRVHFGDRQVRVKDGTSHYIMFLFKMSSAKSFHYCGIWYHEIANI